MSQAASAKTTIATWLDEVLSDPELDGIFPVDLVVTPTNRVEVFIDGDQGVDFDICTRVSRGLEAHLDESGLLGERYVLEVSSPGAARPLQLPRQYPKHVGRNLEVSTGETKLTGQLTHADDNGITLLETVKRKEGKKRITEQIEHKLAHADIREAHVRISFN